MLKTSIEVVIKSGGEISATLTHCRYRQITSCKKPKRDVSLCSSLVRISYGNLHFSSGYIDLVFHLVRDISPVYTEVRVTMCVTEWGNFDG